MTASDRAAIREAAAPYPVFFQRIVMDEVRSRDDGARHKHRAINELSLAGHAAQVLRAQRGALVLSLQGAPRRWGGRGGGARARGADLEGARQHPKGDVTLPNKKMRGYGYRMMCPLFGGLIFHSPLLRGVWPRPQPPRAAMD